MGQGLSKLALGVGASAGVATLAHFLPVTSCLRRTRNRFLPTLAGVGDKQHVALTFDDGPDPGSTPAFLDALDGLGWKATFFMLGSMAEKAPGLAREVADRGHEVAVHGFRHSVHLRRGPGWVANDMMAARDLLADLTGTEPVWARAPYGALTASTLRAARRSQLRPVLWTTWGRDWRARSTPSTVLHDVRATMVPGATVLLHDSDCTSAPDSWKSALGALPALAEMWAAAGLKVGTLSEHGLALSR